MRDAGIFMARLAALQGAGTYNIHTNHSQIHNTKYIIVVFGFNCRWKGEKKPLFLSNCTKIPICVLNVVTITKKYFVFIFVICEMCVQVRDKPAITWMFLFVARTRGLVVYVCELEY